MRVNGKQYKSLTFSVLKDKLSSREKEQTYRVLFVPNFQIGDIIAIAYKENKVKEFLYFATIKDVYPKRLCDLTLEEAQADGFDSVEEMQEAIRKLNGVKFLEHWGFIIKFKGVNEL